MIYSRKCICVNKAVYHTSNLKVEFNIADQLSGIVKDIDSYYESVNNNSKKISVSTISLNDLLDQNKAPLFIDYLSLDTEGSEYEILKNVNFNKYFFGMIDVEHNFVEPKRSNIKKLLESNGYTYFKQNNVDDIYVKKVVENYKGSQHQYKEKMFIGVM